MPSPFSSATISGAFHATVTLFNGLALSQHDLPRTLSPSHQDPAQQHHSLCSENSSHPLDVEAIALSFIFTSYVAPITLYDHDWLIYMYAYESTLRNFGGQRSIFWVTCTLSHTELVSCTLSHTELVKNKFIILLNDH